MAQAIRVAYVQNYLSHVSSFKKKFHNTRSGSILKKDFVRVPCHGNLSPRFCTFYMSSSTEFKSVSDTSKDESPEYKEELPSPHKAGEESSSTPEEAEGDPELEKGYKMSRICDRLIEVFWIEKKEPAEWRKLLAFSKEWTKIRPYFFKRCKETAAKQEDPLKKEALFKLARRLKEVDEGMERHNNLLKAVEEAEDIDTVVTYRRKDFTTEFFDHLQLLVQSNYDNPARGDELAEIAGRCLTAISAHDAFQSDKEAIVAAESKFTEIMSSPDLQTACNKIDDLANRNQLDSHLMLMITKAWAAAKETNVVKEEVQDMMYHLYLQARGNMQRNLPKEVRIMKYLITLEDPTRQFEELVAAFSPGDELEGKDIDYLYTTPEKLHQTISTLVGVFQQNMKTSSVEANKLLNPKVMVKLEMLKSLIEKEFLCETK